MAESPGPAILYLLLKLTCLASVLPHAKPSETQGEVHSTVKVSAEDLCLVYVYV